MAKQMTEIEAALFGALLVMVKAVPDRTALAKKLRDLASDSKTDGREDAATILELLAQSAENDVSYKPTPDIARCAARHEFKLGR